MKPEVQIQIDKQIASQKLPADYWLVMQSYLLPLAAKVVATQTDHQAPFVLGINGAQGTGKSTMCSFLKLVLEGLYDKRCIVLSLDDFYLTLAQRKRLSLDQHPLLKTRGVPGTHDVALAIAVVTALLAGEPVRIPRFDKSVDDVVPHHQWFSQTEPIEIILFEGWCLGATPEDKTALQRPINQLEREEDADGNWRLLVNEKLANLYPPLFDLVDTLLMLKAPDLQTVFEWRTLQETKRVSDKRFVEAVPAFDVRRFVQHFERLTRHMLVDMPGRADCVFRLDGQHRVSSAVGWGVDWGTADVIG